MKKNLPKDSRKKQDRKPPEEDRRRQGRYRQKKLEEEQKNVQFQLEEEIQKPEEVPVQEQEKPRQMNLELLQDEPVEKPKQKLEKETFRLPRFLGQNESGQLTFDMEENVLERQITGQMTIEDILNGWEEKRRRRKRP